MPSFVRFNEDLVIDANGIVPEAKAKAPPDAGEMERARKFLALFGRKTAAISTKHSSYGLKHTAEKLDGYISNGAFIQAAKKLGYKIRPLGPGSLNVCLNITISRGVEHYLHNPEEYRPKGSKRTLSGHVRMRFASDAEEAQFVRWLSFQEQEFDPEPGARQRDPHRSRPWAFRFNPYR